MAPGNSVSLSGATGTWTPSFRDRHRRRLLASLARAGLWRWLTGLLFFTLAAVMLATFRDYGMTGDEGVQHRYGRKLLRWYASLGTQQGPPAQGDIAMYGGFFEVVAEAATLVSPLDAFETRHLVNVAFGLVAFAAVLRMGAYLAGPAGGFFSVLFLVLTPPFYGHSFNNPKDIPFAATFALAAWVALRASEAPRPRFFPAALATGVAIGLAAGVRVAGIALFGCAWLLWAAVLLVSRTAAGARRSSARDDLARLVAAGLGMAGVGWMVMLAWWPWAIADPLRNPFRARQAFSAFWNSQVVFYDGQFVASGDVSRFYLPRWFTLVLPELYLLAFLFGALRLLLLLRERPLSPAARIKLVQIGWLAALAALPVVWVVATDTPLYDGLRHFLFVMPLLAVLAGTSVAAYFRARPWSPDKLIGTAALSASCLLTAVDMVELHPYEAVYFNRLVAGGLKEAFIRYEGDYWCLSFKEGTEWLMRRYSRAQCQEQIRVAGHSTLLQTAYYLRKTDESRRRFKAVGVSGQPHFVLATTRYGDHLQTPGRLVHVVERQGAGLLYIFETRRPACD